MLKKLIEFCGKYLRGVDDKEADFVIEPINKPSGYVDNILFTLTKYKVKPVKVLEKKTREFVAFVLNKHVFITTNAIYKYLSVPSEMLAVQMAMKSYAIKDYKKPDIKIRKVYTEDELAYVILKHQNTILVGITPAFAAKYVQAFSKLAKVLQNLDVEMISKGA